MEVSNAARIYRNGPQIREHIYLCNTEFHELARGVGKTQGIFASRSERLVHLMPRGTGAFVTPTFRKALSDTLPPVITGWQSMGYIRGIHFEVGKRPPKHFREPIFEPLEWKNTISWYNGSIIRLISQDGVGSANGLSLDWVMVDEAKLIKKDRFDAEVVPANRGNRHIFGHCELHHSIFYVSDRWYGSEANWIDELREQVDPIRLRAIEAYAVEISTIEKKLREGKYSDSYVDKLKKDKRRYELKLYELRKNAVYFSSASAIENIHVLGIDYIKKQFLALSPESFKVTVLNEKRNLSVSPFYPHLDRHYHCYTANNNKNLIGLDYDFKKVNSLDCVNDTDLDPNQGLYIAVDPGGNINTIVVGQWGANGMIKVINSFYVKKPSMTSHLIQKVCDYYKPHLTKEVYYYYDQTHIGTVGTTRHTYRSAIVETFEANKWDVAAVYLGAVPPADKRYQLTADKLMKNDDCIPGITFNEENCENLLISIEDADSKEDNGRFQKDKSSEKHSSGIPQEKATHFSDAFDILIWGMDINPHPRVKDKSFQVVTT